MSQTKKKRPRRKHLVLGYSVGPLDAAVIDVLAEVYDDTLSGTQARLARTELERLLGAELTGRVTVEAGTAQELRAAYAAQIRALLRARLTNSQRSPCLPV